MDEKKEIIKAISPLAVLKPQTLEALEAIPNDCMLNGLICIRSLPFKIGRESRVHQVKGRIEIMERPRGFLENPNNDIYLVDRGLLLNISREHFVIDKRNESYILTDRGSACGTIVNNNSVGGSDKSESIELKDGDIISVGSKNSKYIYKFITLD